MIELIVVRPMGGWAPFVSLVTAAQVDLMKLAQGSAGERYK